MSTYILCEYCKNFEGTAAGYTICKAKLVATPKFAVDWMIDESQCPIKTFRKLCGSFVPDEDIFKPVRSSRKKHHI